MALGPVIARLFESTFYKLNTRTFPDSSPLASLWGAPIAIVFPSDESAKGNPYKSKAAHLSSSAGKEFFQLDAPSRD